jgi:dTDP-4-amino-4,6-dideoxygalactose transaminase
VHIFGQPADLGAFRELADRNGIALIEDAAQAFGASFEDYRAGSYGDVATFSFFPTKNLPAMGDAGMAIASSEEVAERLRELRFHGSRDKKTFEHVGVNSRLDEIQAAILRRFLREVDGWNAMRAAAADRYRDLGLGEYVALPVVAPARTHIYHLYVVRSPHRDALQRQLKDVGVASAVYYAEPLHRQPVFAHLGYAAGSLPETEAAAREGLALPMFPTLVEAQQLEVVDAVRGAAIAAALRSPVCASGSTSPTRPTCRSSRRWCAGCEAAAGTSRSPPGRTPRRSRCWNCMASSTPWSATTAAAPGPAKRGRRPTAWGR